MSDSEQVPARDKKGMRTGYTTGSTAAAAAKAAALALLGGAWPERVTITLPIGETADLAPVERALEPDAAFCCVVKDAGDDPDVTHGALVCARVRRSGLPGLRIEGGRGVGRVTLPGLGLEVGGPAINPVPRRQIADNLVDAVREAAPGGEDWLEQHGLEVEISVPEGERLARKTLNPRLGIVGGISILGTTGKVFPYSTAAWRASVIQAVEVAARNHPSRVVLSTGGRSEKYAMALFPELPPVAFVELSIFTGDALRTCAAQGVPSVVFVGMVGKMVKTAQGHMTTHVAGNQVDFAFLAQVCRDTGAPPDLVESVATANTARHVLELCQQAGFGAPLQRIVDLALAQCRAFLQTQGAGPDLEVVLVDFDGAALARAAARGSARAPGAAQAPPLVERLARDPSALPDEEEPE
jgi:cobalt-precorrin-5B (C1)-methyltransferase